MRVLYFERKKQENKSENSSLSIILLTFALITLTAALTLIGIKEKEQTRTNYNEEYVSVFKESEMYDFLGFNQIESEGENGKNED